MKSLGIGDLVMRKSHGGDVIFKVVGLTTKSALLRGVTYRVMADAPLDDIVRYGEAETGRPGEENGNSRRHRDAATTGARPQRKA
ncbi:MAG TPA: hypothetical protein GX506_06460 [Firmicutes bacterium]|nr:hypothetical protein [Bacillota bacterium]